MKQPPHYLVIGNGRVAKHMSHYLDHLQLSYSTFARSKNKLDILPSLLSQSTHVLILINDDAIDTFIENHNLFQNTALKLIHFSGNKISHYAHSAHPLLTFSHALYACDQYKKIPFIIETEGPEFSELLPGFQNPHYKINRSDKNYYHALCVMANNFTTLLWQKFFDEMQNKFKIDLQDMQPIMDQTFHNIKNDYKNALTGPISRQDTKTLNTDLNALRDDNFFTIFNAFTKTFIKEENHE